MLDWLLLPIDLTRPHDVGFYTSWHGRSMVAAWGILAPLAVLTARFLKIWPGQDWPKELDSQIWWRSHWIGQSCTFLLTLCGFWLIYGTSDALNWHTVSGYAILSLIVVQIVIGIFRGSKGGPTAPAADGSLRGDHYDMTPWRLMFERVHKTLGYFLLLLGAATIVSGMWFVNAPRWMWITLFFWWICLTIIAIALQRKGWAVDTYQAIWGPDPAHPGNQNEERLSPKSEPAE